jgi:hypothetical protein
MAGGGGAQNVVVGGLKVIAPKKVKGGKVKQLLIALTPNNPGRAQVALLKGSKIVAQQGATFGAAGTYALKLKLPSKVAAGKYTIRVSFTASGASKAVTKTLKVTVTAAKKAKRNVAAKPRALQGQALARHPVKLPKQADSKVKILH